MESCEENQLQPNMEVDRIIAMTREVLMECGIRAPGTCKRKRKVQPLWRNKNCDKLITEIRKALKIYITFQIRENLIEYKRVNNRVKRELRKIKTESFKELCGNLDF